MAVYNFPNNYLRIKFNGTNDTVKLYMPIAKTDTLPSSVNLRNLGEHAITQYVGTGAPFSWIPSASHPLYRVNDTIVDIYNGLKNVVWDSNYAPKYNFGLYDYRKMFQKCGLNLDSQFIAVALDLMGMLTPPFDTSTHTLYGYIVNANGVVTNQQIRVVAWWSSSSLVETIYDQSVSPPFDYTESTYNSVYSLVVRVSLNSINWGDNFGEIPFLNKSKNQIRTLSLTTIEGINPNIRGFIHSDGYVTRIVDKYYDDENTGYYIDTSSIGNANVTLATANIAKNYSIETGSPYEAQGNSGTSATSGSYDGSSDSIDMTSAPTDNVLSSGMLRAYLPDETVLTSLHSYLFSSGFVDNIIKSLNNPFETIVKLFTLPISISGYTDTIHLGNLDSTIVCDRTLARYIDVNLGTCSIDAYYGLFNDYNTKITLYLPFLNCVDLNVDDVINGTISIIYRVDIMTGDFVAVVKAHKTNARGFEYDSIIFTGGGNMASEIPLTQANTMGLIGSLNSGLQNVQTGNILGSFVSGVSVNTPQTSYSVKGGLSSNSGFLSRLKPYIRLQIDNVVLPTNFKHLVGFKTAVTGSIGSFSGFAKFKAFDFEIGTNEETEKIKSYLQNGIFIKTGTNTPAVLTNGIYLLETFDDDRTCGKTFTTIDSISGVNKAEFLIDNRNIMIEYSGNIDNVNYLYDSDLGRFYFVRQKSIVKNGLYNLLLECDVLQTFADSIKNLSAVCERSETNYNALLLDSEIPKQIDNIVKYIDIGSGFTSFTNVLIAI